LPNGLRAADTAQALLKISEKPPQQQDLRSLAVGIGIVSRLPVL